MTSALGTVPANPRAYARPQPNAWPGLPGAGSRPPAIPYPLWCAQPPYDRDRLLGGLTEDALRPGSVLIMDVHPVPRDPAALESALRAVKARAPSTPVLLRAAADIDDLLTLATLGAGIRAQGVVLRGQPLAGALRTQLTRPAHLPEQVGAWLALKGVRMAPALADLIRQIFARAPFHTEISSLCREIGAVESSARFRCAKKRLPPPSRWLQAARAVHASLRLQADPDRALLPLALELGYADHSALSHQIRRTFGVRPGEVRRVLGWEWLLDRWLVLARERRRPRVTSTPTPTLP
jgi:AraC-like DNA-binding protein